MRWVSNCCEGNHKTYRNYVTLKPLPFDSSMLSKELVKVKNDRQALVVHAVYKSRMTTGVGQPPSSCAMNLMICEHDTRVKSAEIRLF